PFLRDRAGVAYAILAVLVTLVLIWRPIRALGTPLGVIVFVALAFLAVVLLRRETVAEFPTAAAGDTAAAIRARVRRLRENRAHHATEPAHSDGVVSEELERLVALRDSGAITADEYRGVKARLLGTGPPSRP
ncbi:MAG: SHOCT domain-containing protein, partial [Solirubrobacteraceae bacterium]